MESTVLPGATVTVSMAAFMLSVVPVMVPMMVPVPVIVPVPVVVGPAISMLRAALMLAAISPGTAIAVVITFGQEGDDTHPDGDRLLDGLRHGARGHRRQHGASAPRRRHGHDDTP